MAAATVCSKAAILLLPRYLLSWYCGALLCVIYRNEIIFKAESVSCNCLLYFNYILEFICVASCIRVVVLRFKHLQNLGQRFVRSKAVVLLLFIYCLLLLPIFGVGVFGPCFIVKYMYTEQQKKRIFCIFGIVYKLGFKY